MRPTLSGQPQPSDLLDDTGRYFDALGAYRAGDLEPIVEQMCDASYAAVGHGRQLAADLREVRDGWSDRIKARTDSTVWKVADLLIRQPVLDSAQLERELGVSNTNARIALKKLEDASVLTSYRFSKRGRAWRSTEVLQCLDLFAARAGRRHLLAEGRRERSAPGSPTLVR